MARGTGADAGNTCAKARGAAATPIPAAVAAAPSSRRRPLSRHKQRRIAAAYAAGMSVQGLARAFAVSEQRVRDVVIEQGGTLRGRGRPPAPPLDQDTIAKLAREYREERLTSAEIARRHGIALVRVLRALSEAGVEPRHYVLNARTELGVEQRAAIAAAYAAGARLDELKQQYRCCRERIREAIVEHGVPIRRGGQQAKRSEGERQNASTSSA